MGGGGGLGGLALPESLAGRLEARLQLESQSVDNWRRLDAFLGGLFAALQQMDADMQSVKQENARLAAEVKEVNQTLDQTLDAFRARLEESDQKAVQTQIDLAACQAAELTLQQRVRSVEEDLTQSIAETLERERNLDHQLQAVEKRVPTSSELSAIKQQGGKGQDAKDQAGSGGPAERTESNPLGYSQDVRTLEKAMLERLSALRGEVQKQGQDLQATVDGNRLKADSELEVLRNDVAEQGKRLRYVDKISRTSAGVVLKHLPSSGLNKELEAQKKDLEALLADGLLEGKIEADLLDEMANLRKQVGSLEAKLAKMLEAQEAAEINAAAEKARGEAAEKEEAALREDEAAAAQADDVAVDGASAANGAEATRNTAAAAEMDKLTERVVSLESHADELQAEIRRIKEETRDANTCLATLEEFQKGTRRRTKGGPARTDAEAPGVDQSDASEDDFDVLERQLRREIESVMAQLQALDKRVSDSEPPEDDGECATDGTGEPVADVPPRKLTLKGIKVSLDDLRASMYKQIGHERDSRTELEHRVHAKLEETATRDDIAKMASTAAEAKEVSKKTQDEMIDMSMGLRVFMTETEEKLSSKADAKALLQKAGWTEVRDLMGELSAHLSEKLHHSSSTLKGLNEKISNMDGKSASGSLKCISCARPVAPSKPIAHWSKNPLDPELLGGAEEHVHRMKIASAHLYSTDKMPAIESAQRSGGPLSPGFGDDGGLRTAHTGGASNHSLGRHRSPKRGRPDGKYVPWTPEIRPPIP